MKTVWMLLFLLAGLSAHAETFKHIKLTPAFEQYLNRAPVKTMGTLSKSAMVAEDPYKEKLRSAIFGQASASLLKGLPPAPTADGEESLLYEQIRTELEGSHQQIGIQEVTQLDRINRQFNLGSSTFSGFSWQKPMGTVQIYADRQVTPNAFTEDENDVWLVTDLFTIEIEATTYLEKLKEAGVVAQGMDIGAFAGLTFKRQYRYDHYAKDYMTGLSVDFSKLFLPFLVFNAQGINKMADKEIIKRSDYWTAKAGALITTPPMYGFSFSAGALAEYAFEAETSMQTFKNHDPSAQALVMNVWSKSTAIAGATASLQLDFFKLIQITLLKYDLTYEYAQGKNYVLSMNTNDINHVTSNADEMAEWKAILRGNREVKHLEPFVVRLDEVTTEAIESNGSVLLWGKITKNKTEQKRIIKDGKVHTFYNNYATNVRYVQNLLSRFLTAIIYKLLKLPMGTKNVAIYTKNVVLQYEDSHAQATNQDILRVANEEKFSFSVVQSYEAHGISKAIEKQYKNDVLWFVDSFTTLPKDWLKRIKNGDVKGPVRVESELKVEKTGFLYFVAQPVNNVFGSIVKVCKSKLGKDWTTDATRAKLLKETPATDEDKCVRNIGLNYLSFRDDYVANHKAPSLRKFRDFLTQYYKFTENITALNDLFGFDNTFISGRLSGKFSDGQIRSIPFANGQFRGNGVIDNFLRANGGANPASITASNGL
ncbi:MAG: hypothetical protein ACJ76H_13575 [Bacteriovoracaceae bacterium]